MTMMNLGLLWLTLTRCWFLYSKTLVLIYRIRSIPLCW